MMDVIRRGVSEMLSLTPKPRCAIVANVDPARGTVRVILDDAGRLSGHLPIAQHAVGNGWGVVTLPAPGTQVFCIPDTNDFGSMVVVGAVHSSQMPPGKVTPYKAQDGIALVPGEPTMMGPDGQFIRFPAGGGIQSRGTWLHDGDFKASGQITDLDGVHGSLDVLRQAYQAHKHTGVQSGSGTTGATDHPTP